MTSIGKAVSRVFTPPGMGALAGATSTTTNTTTPANLAIPDVPAPLPPANVPSAKPAKKGMQSSFLSGVAASGLTGQQGGGGATGKSLLGS